MRSGSSRLVGAVALTLLVLAVSPLRGDDRGLFGRLFRLGGGGTTAAPSRHDPAPRVPEVPEPVDSPLERPSAQPTRDIDMPPPPGPATTSPALPAPRILPHARVSRPVTEADPLVTRITLARSSDGHQFGMFLQVYADGTVIDSEGVHALDREAVRGVVAALEASDLSRNRGHCGGPPTDFVESVQMIVFDRGLGRLRATSFSFSGNTQGCDAGVRQLQTALDSLQSRLNPPATAPAAMSDTAGSVPHTAAASGAGHASPAVGAAPMPTLGGPTAAGSGIEPIPLTPSTAPGIPPIRLDELGPTR